MISRFVRIWGSSGYVRQVNAIEAWLFTHWVSHIYDFGYIPGVFCCSVWTKMICACIFTSKFANTLDKDGFHDLVLNYDKANIPISWWWEDEVWSTAILTIIMVDIIDNTYCILLNTQIAVFNRGLMLNGTMYLIDKIDNAKLFWLL